VQVPLPHASFPHGDTIPFALTLSTNEHGQKWEPARDEAGNFRLQGRVVHKDNAGVSAGLGFVPVTGSPGSFLAEWWPSGEPRGLYRYEITLERRNPKDSFYARARYTLLRGSLTLY